MSNTTKIQSETAAAIVARYLAQGGKDGIVVIEMNDPTEAK